MWLIGAEHAWCSRSNGDTVVDVVAAESAVAFHPVHHVDREVGWTVNVFAEDPRNGTLGDRRR